MSLAKKLKRPADIALSPSDSGSSHTRPVGVLREAVFIARLPGLLQMLRGADEIIALAEDLADADVHVCGSPSDDRPAGCDLKAPLIRAHRIVETTLRHSHVGEGEGEPYRVGAVPDLLEPRQSTEIQVGRSLQIATRPVSKAQERRGRSLAEVVILTDEFTRSSGMGDGPVDVATESGKSRPVHGDPGWQCPKRVLIHDDRGGVTIAHRIAGMGPFLQPALRVLEAGFNALRLAPYQE
jgi:hypothetical protein